MASGLIIPRQIDGETVGTVSDFIFGSSRITADGDCSHESKTPWKESYDQPTQHIKKQTLLCQQRSVSSRLWFFQWSCMDVRVGL